MVLWKEIKNYSFLPKKLVKIKFEKLYASILCSIAIDFRDQSNTFGPSYPIIQFELV